MDKYQETFNTWNKVAQLYEDKFMDLDIYNATYNLFLKSLKKENASILEIGCGPGNITKFLLTQNPNLELKGIDISENMIQLARKNNPLAKFKVMDGRAIHQLENTFDGIVCGFCIPYLSKLDCQDLFSNTKKLLHPSGILYLSFVDGNYEESGFLSGSSGDRTFFYYHSLDFITTELKANNLEILDTLNISYTKSDREKEVHTIIIAKKT